MSEFPNNPFEILDPNIRWAPSQKDLQEKAYEQLIPPLVYKIRLALKAWRDSDYSGATETSKALLQFWFKSDGHLPAPNSARQAGKKNDHVFQYYFAQREAIESIIYLYEITKPETSLNLCALILRAESARACFPKVGQGM